MRLLGRIPPSLLPALIFTAALAGCAGRDSASADTGGAGNAGSCQAVGCLPKILGPRGLAVEIDPAASSGAGVTEKLNQDLDQSGGPLSLVTDKSVSVTVTFNAASNTPAPASANIVLDIPSLILGRPDLTFQSPVSATGSPSAATAPLSIPQGVIDRMATGALSLIPIPPSDQQSPPYAFSGITFNANGELVSTVPSDNFPNLPSDNFSISGTLQPPSAGQTLNTYIARAFQDGVQVSNAAMTTMASDGSGTFLLQLPSAVAMTGDEVTVQLAPQSAADPLFIFDGFSLSSPPPAKLSLGTVRLPAYLALNQYNLPVVAADTSLPVSGVIVQMQLDLGSTSSMAAAGQQSYPGSTQFSRSATTNSKGNAAFSLLPGNPVAVVYTAVATPPPGSPYATTCAPVTVGVGANSPTTPGAPTLSQVSLSKRTVMSGSVRDSGGRGVPNVTVTATPGYQTVSGCAGVTTRTASQATATTDDQGRYALYLDPGTPGDPISYQLDYDPPAASYVPRYTQTNTVPVDDQAPQVSNDVTLPAGALVAGTVTDANQNLLPSATVRLFDVQCPANDPACAIPPLLRGQAVTNAAGQFQIVLWATP